MKILHLALSFLSLHSIKGLEIVDLSPGVIIKQGLYIIHHYTMVVVVVGGSWINQKQTPSQGPFLGL